MSPFDQRQIIIMTARDGTEPNCIAGSLGYLDNEKVIHTKIAAVKQLRMVND